mgnify:CR=1 FL=1
MTTLINFNKKKKVGVIYFPERNVIRKFTFNKKSYKLIINETKGFEWYQIRNKNILKNSQKIIHKSKNYVDFPIIVGKQKKFWRYLENYYEEAEAVVAHYKKVWPNQNMVPCHGDLTFSNIIFNNNQPIIIDWENFLANKMVWGFDLSYFLISTVSLPSLFHKDKKIKNKELILLEKLWRNTFKSKKQKFLHKPVNYLKSSFGKTFIMRDYFDYFPNLLSKYKIEQINEVLKINR